MTDVSDITPKFKTPSEVANFILDKGIRDKISITPMKLIKMIYIAYGWALGANNIKLFNEEIEAWKFGPAVPSVYHEFKHFGGQPIKDALSQEYDPFKQMSAYTPQISKEDVDVRNILDLVWDLYRDKSATDLMRLTHKKDTPWKDVWKDHPHQNAEIDPSEIRNYYQSFIREVLSDG